MSAATVAPPSTRRAQVVVVTGASSGIGRATAHAFARQGAALVLVARRRDVLDEVAAECRDRGGQALPIAADVADADAMAEVARSALGLRGRIDVWVNNAGAGAGVVGAFQKAPAALHRRTIETNLIGAMNGASAVLPVFLDQGRGLLVNMVSLGGWAPTTPFAAAYGASKFGLRGFTASLRAELADHPHVHVCGVFPAVVDTQGLAHAANLSGHEIDPGPMLYAPEAVAEAVLSLTSRPRAELAVGWPSILGRVGFVLAPRLTERLAARAMQAALSGAGRRPSEGALLAPGQGGRAVSGGWRERDGKRHDARTVNLLLGLAAIGGVALAVRAAARFVPHRRRR